MSPQQHMFILFGMCALICVAHVALYLDVRTRHKYRRVDGGLLMSPAMGGRTPLCAVLGTTADANYLACFGLTFDTFDELYNRLVHRAGRFSAKYVAFTFVLCFAFSQFHSQRMYCFTSFSELICTRLQKKPVLPPSIGRDSHVAHQSRRTQTSLYDHRCNSLCSQS
jgi:hypothetical protein